MGDIAESKQTEVRRITGDDEAHVASVFTRTDGKKALAVDAMVKTNNFGITVPYLNSKYRVLFTVGDITIPKTAYTVVYEYVGSGLLHGFHVDSDSDKMKYKLEIDDEVIFTDLVVKDIGDIGLKVTPSGVVLLQSRSGITVLSNTELDFSPHQDIFFNTRIKLSAISGDVGSKKVKDYLFYISKFS
jgi:hypothetical protein